MDQIATAGSGCELISFRIGAQEYCVDIMSVREIRGWSAATPVPQAPDYVRGVINLRGTVLPIVDLGALLGLPHTDPTARHAVIVAQLDGHLVGLLVDGVSDILTVANESVQPTPEVARQAAGSFVKGLLTIDERMLGLLSLDGLVPAQVMAEAA
jgi:purine-binding chemotaxis protein CheW